MEILVTGGAGFVGSHLCERLYSNGHTVTSLDNYFTGSVANHVEGVTYVKGNTTDIDKLITTTPDLIYHLGEYSRVEQSFDDIDLVHSYNSIGTFHVLEYARKNECKIVYSGSSTKFGDDGMGRNASPYAYTKSSNTDLVVNYGKWFGLKYAITYFYNVYGLREIKQGKYATLVALFKEKIKSNEELTVVSPGTQQRNFTHIDDIIDALLLIGDKGAGDEYGIGSDESFSILEVAKMFKGKVKMIPERPGNRMTSKVVTEKTKQLGWNPKHKLVDYIRGYNNENN